MASQSLAITFGFIVCHFLQPDVVFVAVARKEPFTWYKKIIVRRHRKISCLLRISMQHIAVSNVGVCGQTQDIYNIHSKLKTSPAVAIYKSIASKFDAIKVAL